MTKDLVEIKNLKTYFYTEDGIVKAVDDVSFKIKEGRNNRYSWRIRMW